MGTYLTLDDRSLGAGRIALAAVLLFDLARRIPGLATWYTNEGLLPNHTLLWQPAYDHALSLFYIASREPEDLCCAVPPTPCCWSDGVRDWRRD